MRTLLGILLLIICFILPLHFFVLGNGVGYGLQGAMYQYKITGFGSNLFTMPQDLSYILLGNYSGRTMFSTLSWISGSLILVVATIIWLVNESDMKCFNIISGIMLIIAGLMYLISCIIQYGVFFLGPAGISVPFAIPLILILGYLMITFRPTTSSALKDTTFTDTETQP